MSRHAKLSTQGADVWSVQAIVHAHVMRVMAARARVYTYTVFEKAHALMTLRVTESIRKIAGRDRDVARWLTLTRIPGSVWPIASLTEKTLYKALTYLVCYSVGTSDVEVRQ